VEPTEPTPTGTGAPAAPVPDARPVDVLTVTAVRDVTPAVRRVTLTAAPEVVAAAGPSLSLLVPRVGDPAPQWPEVARDGRIVWPQGSHGVALRSYTSRRQDPDTGELDIDFVLHGDGPAASWATAAAPGAVLGVASAAPLGAAPAGWLLLAGDETALPAISRILAAAGPQTRGVVLLEVGGPEEEQPLVTPPAMQVRWLHRPGAVTDPGPLAAAIAALPRPDGDDLFAWVGAESATVRTIRADLRSRWGLRRSQHHAIGYWRRGRAMSPAG